MVKHIVIWKLKEVCDGKSKAENALMMKQILEELVDKIPAIVSLHVGLKTAESPETNDDVVLVSEFKTWDDFAVYVKHPEHQKVGEFVKKVTEKRSAVDYSIH